MNEKQKAFEAALEACKAAMGMCEDVISIQTIQGYSKDYPCKFSILLNEDRDGVLRNVVPKDVRGDYHRDKMIDNIRVAMCNSYRQEVAYRQRHGLPPLPPMEGQEDKAEEG